MGSIHSIKISVYVSGERDGDSVFAPERGGALKQAHKWNQLNHQKDWALRANV